jgi:hypothetical protein
MSWASLVVVSIYAGTLAVILALPAAWLGETAESRPWWRRVRLWATVVALIQMAIYARFG